MSAPITITRQASLASTTQPGWFTRNAPATLPSLPAERHAAVLAEALQCDREDEAALKREDRRARMGVEQRGPSTIRIGMKAR